VDHFADLPLKTRPNFLLVLDNELSPVKFLSQLLDLVLHFRNLLLVLTLILSVNLLQDQTLSLGIVPFTNRLLQLSL